MEYDFGQGWHLLHPLGEGAYGEVSLLVNWETNEAVATKVIDLSKFPNAEKTIKKEICIHRMLNHENIIKFYCNRRENNIEYIFLEYASGGELFDRIEPDVGMDVMHAHRFFVELISGVEYLHQKGIVHRDLKPENLLLDEDDTLKICDFGMATLFRHNGAERLLTNRCGTMPYIAPEVYHSKEYKAQPIDIWSCGIILVALLAGELPWDRATNDCQSYVDWKESKITESPWPKLDNLVLSLIRKVLMPTPSKRYTLEDIKKHKWFKKSFTSKDSIKIQNLSSSSSPITSRKKQCLFSNRLISASQPVDYDPNKLDSIVKDNINEPVINPCFSQPAQLEDMIISTQIPSGSSQNFYHRLVKRMTRFFTTIDVESTINELKELFDKLNYSWKACSAGQFTISTLDKRRMPLVFRANVIKMNLSILVDFRLSKGDGIEFKRQFIKIKNGMKSIISPDPVTWPLAIATNSLP